MCGIAGIVGLGAEDSSPVIDAMLDLQEHRGPDDRGTWRAPGVHLGHVRLSILDTSSAGHQPMALDDGRLVIVYNGEVFDYLELRTELEGRGHSFGTRTDTEVILRAYDEWGEECSRRFNGMWAFVIYDRDRRKLFFSRDRFGIKPLYFANTGSSLVFASEIKALLAADASLSRVDDGYVARFLRTSRCDDDTRTFFRDVKQLLPAHSMSIDLAKSVEAGAQTPYWTFDLESAKAALDGVDLAGRMRELLSDSVRLRLRSDVPVGMCLSGGLDSSSIVALATAALDGPVSTFSALYPQEAFDESRFARAVAERFGSRHHEVWPEHGNLVETMSRLCWHQDQPTAGPGLYSQWHVMSIAHGGVKVLLDGQGGDELLGGYHSYYPVYAQSLVSAFLRNPFARPLGDVVRGLRAAGGPSLMRPIVLDRMPEGLKRAYLAVAGGERGPELAPEYLELWDHRAEPEPTRGFPDRLSQGLHDAVFRDSLPALLRYEDRNSMAFSIEARPPFLDHRLVEFALALPFDERIDGEWTKAVLRKAMDGILPDEVTWRRDKMGYPTPFSDWIRGDFREDAAAVIFSEEFARRGIFRPDAVRRMWEEHQAGHADRSWNVWRWISLELWFRQFVDGGRSS